MPSLPDQVRQQFDFGPYPRIPLTANPATEPQVLFRHSWANPYYLHYHQVPAPQGIAVLDAGCGTGYRTLALALANPGATVVGVDLSPRSVQLARSRLDHYQRPDVAVHTLDIQDLPSLGLQFDYINCDETLYLFDDLAAGLALLKAVLKPGGILRFNLHSALQREAVYRGQAVFRHLGLLEQNPETDAVQAVQGVMGNLKAWVNLKQTTWKPKFAEADATEDLLMNYLFQGDRGYTIPQLFAALEQVGLGFIAMVNWQQWQLADLFQQPQALPPDLRQRIAHLPLAERLHLFELLHPVHRLLDVWCVNGLDLPQPGVAQWDAITWAKQWNQVQVHLHPQLRTAVFRQACLNSWKAQKPQALTTFLDPGVNGPVVIDSRAAVLLMALVDTSPQPLLDLIKRSLELFPRDPDSLDPVSPEMALAELKNLLIYLEQFLYVLLEHRPRNRVSGLEG